MQAIILHHYDFSNYAEKVRLALGYKNLDWYSVDIPPVAPKPSLQALTGGYRRTPVLQLGADLYCDTRLILRVLERLAPAPTLYPEAVEAQANAVAYWAENQLFRPIALYVSGSNPEVFPLSLQADRARMRGRTPPSASAMERAARRSAPLVRSQVPQVERMLEDGRPFLLGTETSVADFSVYHALWFITGRTQRLAFELAPFPHIKGWMERMAAFGHGQRNPFDANRALGVATNTAPANLCASAPQPEDPDIGSHVRVRADDYGQEPVEGELVQIDADEFAVARHDEKLGHTVVHFPRLGFDLRPNP